MKTPENLQAIKKDATETEDIGTVKKEAVSCIMGNVTIFCPRSKSDGDIHDFCDQYLDEGKCLQEDTKLSVTVVDFESPPERIKVEEFSDEGLKYLIRNSVNFKNVTLFPPSDMITHDLTKYMFEKLAQLLNKKDETGLRAVVSNYDDFKYYKFIKDPMKRDKVKEMFQDISSENRLLLFYSRLSTIFTICIVKEKGKLLKEMENCIKKHKSFIITFKWVIEKAKSNIILIPLIICPYISRKEIEAELKLNKESAKNMKLFFLTKDELENNKNGDDANLIAWWIDFRRKLKSLNPKITKTTKPGCNANEEIFKRILGQCMATIACCDMENKSMLPTLSDDAHKQILTLLLNVSQLEAISNKEKKKLVYGPFGSGKTIVAESVIRKIYEESLKITKNVEKSADAIKTLIFYAIQDEHSLLEVRNLHFVDRLEEYIKRIIKSGNSDYGNLNNLNNVKIECNTFRNDGKQSLLNFVRSSISEAKTKSFKKFNFVLDEVAHDSVKGENDIKEINEELENVVDHFVVFPRSNNLQMQSAGDKQIQSVGNDEQKESYLYQLFPEKAQRAELNFVMRNTCNITGLTESTQRTVENSEKSSFQVPFFVQDPKSDITDSHLKKPDIPSVILFDNSTKEVQRPPIDEVYVDTIENLTPNEEYHSVKLENTESVSRQEKFVPSEIQIAKMGNQNKAGNPFLDTFEVGSSFLRSKPGHNVKKGEPNQINLPKEFEIGSEKGRKVLSIVLDKIIFQEFDSIGGGSGDTSLRSPVIICNNMEEVKITYYALLLITRLNNYCVLYAPHIRNVVPTLENKKEIYGKITDTEENKILITDAYSFRGMESPHVITFINPSEKFDQHLLPEIITRATTSLDVIVFPVDDNNATTLMKVLKKWKGRVDVEEERKLVKEIKVITPPAENQDQLFSWSDKKNEMKIYTESAKFKEYGKELSFDDFEVKNKEELEIGETPDITRHLPQKDSTTNETVGAAFKIAGEYQYWNRIITLIHYGGKELCSDIIHRQEGLPTDGNLLYNALSAKRTEFQRLLNRRVIRQNQFDLIFPPNQITDTSEFDITLYTFVISVMFGRKYQNVIDELRKWRNKEFLKGNVDYTEAEFELRWDEFTTFLKDNGCDISKETLGERAAEYGNWNRIMTLVHYGGKELCLDIIHSQEGLSTDGNLLYNALSAKRTEFERLLSRRVIRHNQFDLIFPPNQITDISEFDITIYTFVISVMFGRKYQNVIDELRKWRNKEFLKGNVDYTEAKFELRWNEFTTFLKDSGYDISKIEDLKTCGLDKNSQYWKAYLEAEILRNSFGIEENKQNIVEIQQDVADVQQDIVRTQQADNKQNIGQHSDRVANLELQGNEMKTPDNFQAVKKGATETEDDVGAVKKGANISDLQYKHIDKLSKLLDPSRRWYQLGLVIFEGDEFLTRRVETLELDYSGGGNPALEFLELLATRKPELPIIDFQDKAKALKRNDISLYIEENISDKSERLSQLEFRNKDVIASYLNKSTPDWKHFAGEYGLSLNEIEVIATKVKSEGNYSPTKKLIQLLRQSKPELRVQRIQEICKEQKNVDVLRVLIEIEKELSQSKN